MSLITHPNIIGYFFPLLLASGRVAADVRKLLRHFTALESGMVSDFGRAMDAVGTLSVNETYGNVSQTPQTAAHWPLSWLFAQRDKYQAARSAVTKANSTVAKVGVMLDSLDEQAANLILENTLWTTQKALQKLSSPVDTTDMVHNISWRVKEARGVSAFSENALDAKVNTVMNTIHTHMSVARTALPLLYQAANVLMGQVEQADGVSEIAT